MIHQQGSLSLLSTALSVKLLNIGLLLVFPVGPFAFLP